jgi:CheY-like chemotaxis protein
VKDTGPGIPDNMLGLIFDRFGQVNQQSYSQPSGTGLGLPISKNLVKLMGGEMWVESKVNKGSIFRFTLPLVIEQAVDEPRIMISNKSYNWTGRRILVAEDEILNWMFINEMLKKSGAEILHAEDGNQAVKITRKLKPDAILMDLKMPGLNGIEATRKIRTFNKKVPIIAQTAFVMAEEKVESKLVGCNHFVTKPLDRTVIMELIDSYFNKK